MAKQLVIFVCLLLFTAELTQAQTLRQAASSHGKYMGVAVSTADLTQHREATSIAEREFDCFTPENAMKWDATEPSRGQFHFNEGDTLVQHAQAHGIKVRGHTLVWHSQLPGWVNNGHSKADLEAIMKNHIETVAKHFKGKIYAWDVVNEVFNEDGSLRQSPFFNTLGKGFIADAFRFAHEADPGAKLYINDYNVEDMNAKSNGLYNLVKELHGAGVPIHGVGFQTHLQSGQIPHDLQRNLERFAALGLDVALTEVDIKANGGQQLQQQANDYASVVRACMAVSRCVGITVWGVSDKYSWIQNGAPLLYDNNYKEKPAYNAVKQAFGGH